MAVTPNPIHIQSVRTAVVTLATANTNRDGTGTLSSAVSAGADGSKLQHIAITATGSTTAGVVRVFIYDGSAYRLWKEILVPAITPSTTVKVFEREIDCSRRENTLYLSSTQSLKFSTHNAEGFNVSVILGDY